MKIGSFCLPSYAEKPFKILYMISRVILLTALCIYSNLLPAQIVQLLEKSSGSLKTKRTVSLQLKENQDLSEQEYCRSGGKVKNILSLADADLKPISGGELVEHTWYTLAYSEENEQAFWVYYRLTFEMLQGATARTDNFRSDDYVSTGSAHPADYEGTGYDRGHLCPAADMTVNQTAMLESFYMSNMSPQVPAFNRGIWKKLEETVRKWAAAEETIHIVTGPVFKDNPGVLPNSKVTIPGHFYKVIFDPTDEPKMIALVLPNARGKKQLPEYVVTVNYIETLTGLDFFAGLPDELENRLEATSNSTLWDFNAREGRLPDERVSQQCHGHVKSTGRRCRNTTTNPNGFCHLHQPSNPDARYPATN